MGIDTLTQRQKEILRLISQHMQAKEVARALNISERTVKTHTDAARKRLGVATSRDAARLLAAHEAQEDTRAPGADTSSASGSLVPDGRWPSRPMDGDADGVVLSGHEQTLQSAFPAEHNARHGAVERPGDRLADARGAGQGITDYRDGGRSAGGQPVGDIGEGSVHNDRGDRLVDRRWAGFERRLAALSAVQWLGLIAIVGVLAAVLVGGLIVASLGTMEAIEDMHRQIG